MDAEDEKAREAARTLLGDDGGSTVEAARTILGPGLADAVRTPPAGEAAAVLGPPLACAIARRLEAAARVLGAADRFILAFETPGSEGPAFPLCDSMGALQVYVKDLRALGGPPSAEELDAALVDAGTLAAEPALDAADEIDDGGPEDICAVCGAAPTSAAPPVYRTARQSPWCDACRPFGQRLEGLLAGAEDLALRSLEYTRRLRERDEAEEAKR